MLYTWVLFRVIYKWCSPEDYLYHGAWENILTVTRCNFISADFRIRDKGEKIDSESGDTAQSDQEEDSGCHCDDWWYLMVELLILGDTDATVCYSEDTHSIWNTCFYFRPLSFYIVTLITNTFYSQLLKAFFVIQKIYFREVWY